MSRINKQVLMVFVLLAPIITIFTIVAYLLTNAYIAILISIVGVIATVLRMKE